MDRPRACLAALVVALLLAPLTLAAAPAKDAAPTAVTPQAGRLKDGSNLLVLRIPGAKETSLRWIVGAGALRDPEGRAGLAHMVEHLIFHGSYDTRGPALHHAVREAGGSYNAYTMVEATMFVLDAPRAAFHALAGRYLRTVTNPALNLASLETERGVVQTESEMRPSEYSLRSQIDLMLFPGLGQSTTVIGSTMSRTAITRTDVVDYFGKHYTPSNTWAVFAGDVDFDEASRLVEENSCLPPEPALAPAPLPTAQPRLPIDVKARSLLTVVVFGYTVEGASPLECRTVAAVLERRLKNELIVKDPLVSAIEVDCPRYRGVQVLQAIGFSTSVGLEVSRVPEIIESQFASLAKTPPTREELQSASRHREVMRALLGQSPAQLAEAAAMEIIQGERDPQRMLARVNSSGSASTAACRALAEGHFKEENKISIQFSPYHGDY